MKYYKIMFKFHDIGEKYRISWEEEDGHREDLGIKTYPELGIAYIPRNLVANDISIEFYVNKLRDEIIKRRLNVINHLQEDIKKLLEVEHYDRL